MRITQQILFSQALDGVRRHTEALSREQAQISSGKRWERPSEDPAAAARSFTTRFRSGAIDAYAEALAKGRDRINAATSALQDLSSILAHAKELGVQAGNDTLSASDDAAIADEVDAVLSQVLEISNRRDGYGYLFAGTADGLPFLQSASGVSYQGNDAQHEVPVGDVLKLSTSLPGSEVFATQAREKTLFFPGKTGVKAGTGTDSGTDRDTLLVTHGATTYGDGAIAGGGDSASGIKPGTSSAAGDTVIGSHVLAVDDVAKTLSLDGGPAVSYAGTETDLSVASSSGVIVKLDVTSITGGFQGNVTIAATGFLSTDGGATQTAINFSANQTITDSVTGATTNVDSSGITAAGSETVDYVGTSNLFQALTGLRDDLKSAGSLSSDAKHATIAARLREIERNFGGVLGSLADLGSRMQTAENAAASLGTMKDQLTAVTSDLEDADMADVVVRYQQSQIALQIAQTAGAQLMNLDYLAFLR